jgi:predicted NBD/HSP70 family sugar kinase
MVDGTRNSMTQEANKPREDSVLRFLRVVHRNGLNLRERQNGEEEVEARATTRHLTQVDAAQEAGLSRPSVASYAQRMRGTVLDSDALAIKANSGYAIGVDISETRGARVALSDMTGQIVETLGYEDDDDSDRLQPQTPGEALDFAEKAILQLLDAKEVRPRQIIGVCISLPGPVKDDNLIGRDAGIWRHLSAANELARRLGWEDVPFETQSDTYLSALAENLWGGGQIADNTLYVKWAARLRAAIVIDGKLYTGHTGTAGELPHQEVEGLGDPPPDGLRKHKLLDACPICRHERCLHMIARLRSLSLAITNEPGKRASRLVEVAEHDAEARRILNIAAGGIGRSVAPLIDALDPETVVIGGALGSRAFPLVFEALTGAIGERAIRYDSVTVRGGRVEERTAVRGAVALALLRFAPKYLQQVAG